MPNTAVYRLHGPRVLPCDTLPAGRLVAAGTQTIGKDRSSSRLSEGWLLSRRHCACAKATSQSGVRSTPIAIQVAHDGSASSIQLGLGARLRGIRVCNGVLLERCRQALEGGGSDAADERQHLLVRGAAIAAGDRRALRTEESGCRQCGLNQDSRPWQAQDASQPNKSPRAGRITTNAQSSCRSSATKSRRLCIIGMDSSVRNGERPGTAISPARRWSDTDRRQRTPTPAAGSPACPWRNAACKDHRPGV